MFATVPTELRGEIKKMSRSRSPKREMVEVPPLEAWTIASMVGAGEGVQTAQISYKGGSVQLTFKNLFSPFEPSSLDGNVSRQTLTLRLSKEWEVKIREVEHQLLKRVSADSLEIFGRSMTEDQVFEYYRSFTRKAGEYPMNIRVKINHTGLQSTRYWDENGNRSGVLQTFSNKRFNVVVDIRALWKANDGAFGLVLDATDIQMVEASGDDAVCPF